MRRTLCSLLLLLLAGCLHAPPAPPAAASLSGRVWHGSGRMAWDPVSGRAWHANGATAWSANTGACYTESARPAPRSACVVRLDDGSRLVFSRPGGLALVERVSSTENR